MQIVDKIFFDPITKALKFFGKSGQMTQLGEQVAATITATSVTTSEADITGASITLQAGVWLICYQLGVRLATGSTALNESAIAIYLTDSSNVKQSGGEQSWVSKTPAANSLDITHHMANIVPVTITSQKTFKLRSLLTNFAGTAAAAQITSAGGQNSTFRAIRIG